MPMKVGTKMVDAETRTTSAVYMVFPLVRATGLAGNAALYYCFGFGEMSSAQAVLRS